MNEPIRRAVTVPVAPDEAFRMFTREMASWWTLATHSMAADREDGTMVESLVFEEHEGGRVYEVDSKGNEGMWATVLAWDPPTRFVLAWKPNLRDEPPTEVEVTFTAEVDGTRVALEHRGWERLGERGPEAIGGYERGWSILLERYAGATQAVG
jgi:uncharacterized protein YndB with AHSA1/START domain